MREYLRYLYSYLTAMVFAFLLALIIPFPAFAQIITAVQAGVDLTPVANNAITIIFSILTVVAGVVSKFAIGFLASKTKMSDTAFEALLADRMNDILQRSIDYAEAWSKQQVADPNSPLKNIQVNNFFVETALRYVLGSAPDIISYFGLTEDRIKQMILSRLNGYMAVPVADSGTGNISLTTSPQPQPAT